MKKATPALLAALLLATSATAFAKQQTYTISPSEKNKVEFTSDAPVEVINGTTHNIQGKISYDDAFKFDAKHPFNVSFNVDLKKIETGIPLRDEHMRDNFLETSKYPEAVFQVTSVQPDVQPPFKPGQVVTINSTGNFMLHGKTVVKNIPVRVTYHPKEQPGDTLHIEAKFPVKLVEHNIQRPEMVFQKLAETVFVTVDAYAKAK